MRGNEVPWVKIYPALRAYPVTTGNGELTAWMLTHTRPIVPGLYDVRFRHTEPHVLQLWWSARPPACWRVPGTYEPVSDDQFLSWRGRLA